ncbi:MAG: hypothetical protein ACBR13_17765, partial [Microcoleus sp.]
GGNPEARITPPYPPQGGNEEGRISSPYPPQGGNEEGRISSPYPPQGGNPEARITPPYTPQGGNEEGNTGGKEIVPAQGWVMNSQGDVMLVGYNSANTTSRILRQNPVCIPR